MQPQMKPQTNAANSRKMADAIRFLSMDAVEKANSGHPGMPMGMADVATVLFSQFLKFDPSSPSWPDRDRFVLSAGHGSMLIYSLLYLTGYEDMTLEDLKNFRQLGAKTAGHPEYGHAAGIETTTGPLGQGIANAVGMALAERMMAARFANLVDHYTYAIAGDGCLMEGISQEAISLAGHLKLSKLIVLWDDNKISIDGPTSLSTSEDMAGRFKSAGWNVDAIDGHDHAAIATAIAKAQKSDKPTMIACRTTIAFGAPTKSGSEKSHGSPLGKDEIAGTRSALGWQHEPFEIPADVLEAWREVGNNGKAAHKEWQKQLAATDATTRGEFCRLSEGKLPANWYEAVAKLKASLLATPVKEASRKSSENALKALAPVIPELIGGSADLTGSNNTKTGDMQPIKPGEFAGRYIYYGIREHGMAAVMNGMSLHGGFVPYGGTFLVFSDYCRPSIRLSALMNQGVVYVMTHDSIGLGEDGPTHQPVEHLAALRAIPNLLVMRPSDAIETLEAWEIAISNRNRPTLLALSRQNLPQLRLVDSKENLSARGGYVLSAATRSGDRVSLEHGSMRESAGERGNNKTEITIIGTGSETHLAIEAQQKLAADGIAAEVVSMPCWRLFDEQDESYKKSVLPPHTKKIAVEAAIRMGWDKYIGSDGEFVGMEGFGASAPAEALYPHFKITVDEIVKRAKKCL